MRDPFPIPPIPWLSEAVTPLAMRFGFPTLPLHIHEVIFATGLYTFIHLVVSPRLSNWLAPKYYPKERGKRVNWDSHVVSMFQALLINGMALWTMAVDEERASMTDYQQRIWGYSGGCALVQSFAAGYFVWDLVVSLLFVDVFGLGMLAHAACALGIYTLGYVSDHLRKMRPLNLCTSTLTWWPCSDLSSTSMVLSSSCTSFPRRLSTYTGSSTSWK
jgi:hypothetical protein